MRTGRFFVTYVLILATAVLAACTPKKEKRQAQVREGNQQIQAAARAQNELGEKYKIILVPGEVHSSSGKTANAQNVAEDFNWHRLTREERQGAKETLAAYVTAVSRTLEIDAKKGVYMTGKEILQYQLESARAYQRSLEEFEVIYGESYNPKNPKDQPLFIRNGKA